MTDQLHMATGLASLARRFDSGAQLTRRDIEALYGITSRTAQRWINAVDEHLVTLDRSGWVYLKARKAPKGEAK